MILTCPECATRYLIDPAALPPEGRRVRCAKCGTTWREEPPADMPKRIEVEPPPQRLRPLAPGANLPALPKPPKQRSDMVAWLVLLAIVVAIGAGLWFGAAKVIEVWPDAAKYYAAIGKQVQQVDRIGLNLRNVRSTTPVEGGVPVLVVTGEIVNPTSEVKPVPKLRVALRNADKQEIYHWFFTADDSQIAPDGKLAFTTRLSGPPPEARDLQVTFVGPEGAGKP